MAGASAKERAAVDALFDALDSVNLGAVAARATQRGRVVHGVERIAQQVRSKQVVLGMRPEHMVLGGRGLRAEVEMVETLGSEQLVHLRSGKTQLVVRATTRELTQASAKVGDLIDVGPDDRHALHWYELEGGKRVAGL